MQATRFGKRNKPVMAATNGSMPTPANGVSPGITPAPLKLDLSFGELPPGHTFTRVAKLDPLTVPWPLASESVDEAWSAYLFQRIPACHRFPFMDELWRVLKPGAKATFIVPYWTSARAVQDPGAEWPPLCEQSFLYFNAKFRTDNRLSLPWRCDFDFVYGHQLDPETAARNDETRPFWVKHYANAVSDLQVSLIKKP